MAYRNLLNTINITFPKIIDDFFKETSIAYENYAQRLAAIYEATREPEDFIHADLEFKKIIKKGNCSTEDLRLYGIMHHYMMQYCIHQAIDLFDKVIERGKDINNDVFWQSKHQKNALVLTDEKRSGEY